MPDIVDRETRSRMMGSIKGKNTRPEMVVRRGLHGRGFRFRLHRSSLPGRPDLVFPRWGAVVFVHGCFWHRHHGCRFTSTPGTRQEFWARKFEGNVSRDTAAVEALGATGWRVAVVWECAVKQRPGEVLDALADWLRSDADAFIAE